MLLTAIQFLKTSNKRSHKRKRIAENTTFTTPIKNLSKKVFNGTENGTIAIRIIYDRKRKVIHENVIKKINRTTLFNFFTISLIMRLQSLKASYIQKVTRYA